MRKFFAVFFTLVLCLLGVVLVSCGGEGKNVDKFEFVLGYDKKFYILKDYSGRSESVVIPDTYNDLPVTNIGDGAFAHCDALKSVVIPDSVVSIGDNVFYDCKSLTDVKIPDSVKGIGHSLFYGCTKLESVTIPDSVTYIGGDTFYNCTNLVSITIPYSITEIPDKMFYNCEKLSTVHLPDGITKIGKSAFYDCLALTSITLGNRIEEIGEHAFNGCSALEEITLPNSMWEISDYTFSYCVGLTSVTIPDGIDIIGDGAFKRCTGLTNITIPNSVTSIGSGAFNDCSELVSITLPFVGADNKERKNTYFGYIFGAPSYDVQHNFVPSTLKTVVITGGLQVDAHAFERCGHLENVNLPNTLTRIGEHAFDHCAALTGINIPDNVYEIADYAFSNCSFTSVTIPNNVSTIGTRAFYSCGRLRSVTLGTRVWNIGNEAFRGCGKLIEVINYSSLDIVAGSLDYGEVAGSAKEVHTGESRIVDKGDYLFYTYDGISYLLAYVGTDTELMLPANYNGGAYKIYNGAFGNCAEVTSITIPATIIHIGFLAFDGYKGDIYFDGTKAAWMAIPKADNTLDYRTVHCTDGTLN